MNTANAQFLLIFMVGILISRNDVDVDVDEVIGWELSMTQSDVSNNKFQLDKKKLIYTNIPPRKRHKDIILYSIS